MTDSTVKIVPMLPAHLKGLVVHEYLGHIQETLNESAYAELLAAEDSYSFIADGVVVGVVGITQCALNRWHGWALLSSKSAKYMIQITRLVNEKLDELKKPRVETHVRCDFVSGLRWAKMLKFECETPKPMKNFGDDGYDYYLYARCA